MNRLLHALKQKVTGLSIALMRLVIKQPQLKEVALYFLTKIPKTKTYLNNIALSGGLSTKQYNDVTFAEFNDELAKVSISNISHSKVSDIDYFESNIAQNLCQTYALNFDFDLIEKIRQGKQLNYGAYSGDKLKVTIVHFYLAILYRFPSDTEIHQCTEKLANQNNFAPLMKVITDTPENQQRGRKEVIA